MNYLTINDRSPTTKNISGIQSVIRGIINFFFPLQCLVCNRRLHSLRVCYRCWPNLPPYFYHNRCHQCFTPLNASELTKLILESSPQHFSDALSLHTNRIAISSHDQVILPPQNSSLPISDPNVVNLLEPFVCAAPCYNSQPKSTTISDKLSSGANSMLPILCNHCKHFPPLLNSIRFLWNYQERARDLIVTMKYRPSKLLCRHLAVILSQQSHQLALINYNSPPDIIAPIPITRRSYLSRSFHQTGLLAKTLTRINRGLPNPSINLLKTRQNKSPQASLKHHERLNNVSGSFRVNDDVYGKSVLLVEDVITTGATISAAASAILAAGAKTVSVIALARSSTWETFRFANLKQFPLIVGSRAEIV